MSQKVCCFICINLIFLLAHLVGSCGAEGLIQEVDDAGTVDWGMLQIRCTAVGAACPDTVSGPKRPRVLKSARDDALDKILRILDAIAITSESTVGEVLDKHDDLRGQVRTLASRFREKSIHYMSDGSVEIEVEFSLRGELLDLILPPSAGGSRISDGLLCPLCGQPWPKGKEIPPDLKLDMSQTHIDEPYSSLVIDARGLGLRPALAPRVFNKEGKVVYGVEFARRPRAILGGIVAYEESLQLAQKKKRASAKPFTVNGLKATGHGKTDVVIENDQAALLHSMPEHLKFFEECRVIIVID